MPVQAIPMALVASMYPLGLAVLAVLAEMQQPRARVAVFLTGAVACTLGAGFVVVFVLHGAGLGGRGQQTPRYGLRLALGVVLLIAGGVVAWRPARPRAGQSRIMGLAARGGLFAALLAGLAMYLPSPVYLTALQDVGSSKLNTAGLVVWVVFVALLALITLEVPVLAFLLAPEWTIGKLRAVSAWRARHGHTLLVAVLAALGLWLVIDGLTGLI